MHLKRVAVAAVLTGSLVSGSALAAVFPDVPTSHQFREAIEQLSAAGVIKGNPDGTFSPERTVNRAEMLTMLYRATGVVPAQTSLRCFPDVDPTAWYASYICDAAVRKFVKGYADGNFLPGNTVNRVEALKMVQEVLGFALEVTQKDRDLIKFVDVSVSAWYADYLANAYRVGVLPVPGQSASRFEPEVGLSRGEAAAYIWNGLRARIAQLRQTVSSSSASGATSSQSSSQQSSVQTVFDIQYPFDFSGKFTGTQNLAYRFTVGEARPASITVRLQSNQPGKIRCTLYKQEASDLIFEYYLGIQEGSSCHLLTKLAPGSYQLQVEPTDPNVTFTVTGKEGNGDGNDGFSEAHPLYFNTPKTYVLARSNLQNWYRFVISGTESRQNTLELTNEEDLSCLIYPMADVDIFGFENPECNHTYLYPPGTYYVGVSRRQVDGDKETFTIRLIPSL